MIVNLVREFQAKCNRTVVILRVCLFCSAASSSTALAGRSRVVG